MKLKLSIDIIEISYKDKVVFKSAEFNNGNETTMDELNWKAIPFEMDEVDKKIATDAMVVYDNELNAEGYDEMFRFISCVENYDFFKVVYKTEKLEV